MPNKVLMIGGSICVAVLLLLLAVWAGGPGEGHEAAPEMPVNPDLFLGGPDDGEQLPLGEAEGLVYEIKESGILFFANRIVPKPQGAIDVIETTIQIHLAPGRELTIDADEGTIIAPDNHPREGEMRGHVIVTLYETPDGSEVDMHSDRDVIMRIFFDDPVQFDLELQQIDSEGPIFMTGPQVQFRGRGLSLNFNQLKHRIERLIIEEGESLHYIPKPAPFAGVPVTTAATTNAHRRRSPGASPAAPAGDQSSRVDVAETDVPAASAAAESPSPGRPIQYYLATFEQLNDVRVGHDQYVIEGDDLYAIFSAKAAGEKDNPAPDSEDSNTPDTLIESPVSVQPSRASRPLSLASSDPMSEALLYALAAAIGQIPDEDPRSLATFTDEDVVITWSGRLTVSPLSDVPEALAGPDDVMVTVKGKPATIVTDQGESISAPEVSFLGQHAALLAKGADNIPVQIESPELGSLKGVELSIDQTLGTGYVVGPGSLTGLIREKGDSALGTTRLAEDATSADTPTPNTRPISVSFDDRLDLAFYLKQDQTPVDPARPLSGDNRIKGVKSADFLGKVRVDYDELDMTADRLTLALLEELPGGAKREDDKLSVESLSAIGNVQANVKSENVKVFADRLFADPAKDQLELFGTPASDTTPATYARVVRPDATLAGEHLVMDENGGTVDVPGPGSFDFLPEPENPGKTVHITWVTSMHYDDLAGQANFVADVQTLSTDGTDTNELMGDDLVLTFVKDDSADAKADATSGGASGGRRLATAVMNSNVRFRARSYATAERKDLQTELFLIGPRMEFNDPGLTAPVGSDEALQQVQVIGTGRMLITDTRPQDDAEAAAKPANGSSIDIAGRGRTAFEWSDRLVLDLTHGEMLMKGAVAMVHQPAPGSDGKPGERVQLDCQDLAAELKKSGDKKKSSGWLSEDAPKPVLSRVWADHGIRILHGPATVTCDHLLYEEDKREIILWSDEPHVVTFESEGEPTPAKSSAFKWHRDTGRVEAFKLRTGTIPLRRSERP